MNFNRLATDWWTARGWLRSAEGVKCEICDSSFGIAAHPEVPKASFCQFHSQMTVTGMTMALHAKKSGQKIDRETWNELRLNSYDRDTLIPYMSDEVLLDSTAYTLKNCQQFKRPASVYDEALQLYAAELAKRLAMTGTLQGFVNRHMTWAMSRFPDETLDQKLIHLQREVGEVRDRTLDMGEWADCGMLLFHSLARAGFSVQQLIDAMEAKFEEIQKRKKWVRRPDGGDYQSIKD